MPTGLQLSDVVRVDVTLTPLAIPTRNFGVPLIIGSSEVIDTYERRREYSSLDQVGEDFNTSMPEYKAATAFFAQNPQPAICYIGRWAQQDTNAILYGGVLSPAQQLVSNWDTITDGAMFIWINDIPHTISGLNFQNQTNLNGIANVLEAALNSALSGTTCDWLSPTARFKLVGGGASGTGSKLTWATPPTAWASITYTKQPANNDVITIAGTGVKWVTGTPANSLECKVGNNLAASLLAMQTLINESDDANLMTVSAIASDTVLYIYANATGTGGNNITLVLTTDTGNAATLGHISGGKLSGGTGTDVSSLFRLSSAASAPAPVNGIAAETAADCVEIHMDQSHAWYGAIFACATQPSLADQEEVAQIIEAASPLRTYFYTTGDSTVLDNQTTADPAGSMHTLNLARTCGQFSTTNPYAICSLFGRFANVDFRQNNSMITAKFKREPGIVGEVLSETQAQTIANKKINVFAYYDVDVSIIQEGVMANGDFIDERFGCDWLQNALQVSLFNALYTSPTKIPQTNAGTAILVAACKQVLEQGVFNGFIAPGQWNGPPLGILKNGNILTTGYYIFVPDVNTQSQADREARKSVPIQIAIKLAGAVHSVICSVWVNR